MSNKTDLYLRALTVLVLACPGDKELMREWYSVCTINARRFARSIQKGLPDQRDPDIVANDATASFWENVFVKGHKIKKSATTMLYYRVKHYSLYRTKKDFELSYDQLLEDGCSQEGSYDILQGVQKDAAGRFILRGPQSDRRESESPKPRPPLSELSWTQGWLLPELRLEETVKADSGRTPRVRKVQTKPIERGASHGVRGSARSGGARCLV